MTFVIGAIFAAVGLVFTFCLGYLTCWALAIGKRHELEQLRNHKCPAPITAEELHRANRKLWDQRGHSHLSVIAKPDEVTE